MLIRLFLDFSLLGQLKCQLLALFVQYLDEMLLFVELLARDHNNMLLTLIFIDKGNLKYYFAKYNKYKT